MKGGRFGPGEGSNPSSDPEDRSDPRSVDPVNPTPILQPVDPEELGPPKG
jgi:hypothetical protein